LLWFHQRWQKPGWWALFERLTWTEEELTEDPESLGGLVRDPNSPPVVVKQSTETTYPFVPQDTKLKIGDTPKIAETIGYAGSISALSAEDGYVVLRRGNKSGTMPDRLSLVPAPIDMQHVPDAVIAFAERFASGQGDLALLDILMRTPPRFCNRPVGGPVQQMPKASLTPAKDLDSSYLFIQGPPGTGKDAKTQRFTFVGVKRGSKDDPGTAFDGTCITTVFKSEEVTSAHRLVGGTVFHFSRDDQRQALIICSSTRRQVSLGNLVAMGGCARNIILVGDQMQLPQPVQGVHPGESGLSSLEFRPHTGH
jgi:hypothetical protein